MLVLARRLNESIIIGDEIEVVVIDIKGDQVKLGIRAPIEDMCSSEGDLR